jgi:2-octaprenyl-6-methoxyphenol hydroxylase
MGSAIIISAYSRKRRGDIAARTFGIDLLNRSLLADYLATDLFRGAGLMSLKAFGPLRRFVMREGVLPHLSAPKLMRPVQSA